LSCFALSTAFPSRTLAHRRSLRRECDGRNRLSEFQLREGHPPEELTIWAEVKTSANAPVAGRTVYFRLHDPPDTAFYRVINGDAAPNDNKGVGTINGGTTAVAVTDGAGRAAVTLKVSPDFAADNYRIEASLDPNFACGPSGCPRTGEIATWKRVYAATSNMFRRGAFLTEPLAAGSKSIPVSDVSIFPKPPFKVMLIHAADLESADAEFRFEETTIVATKGGSWFSLGKPQPGILYLDDHPEAPGLQQAYSGPAIWNGLPRQYLADAVGVITGTPTADFFRMRGTLVDALFRDASVEVVWMTDDPGADDLPVDSLTVPHFAPIPFIRQVGSTDKSVERELLARRWIRMADRSGKERASLPNHQTIFSAARAFNPHNFGVTVVASGFNDTWIFTERATSAANLREVTVHELTHQWRVNQTVDLSSGGHCDAKFGSAQFIAASPTRRCTMTSGDLYASPEGSDSVVGFHYIKPAGGEADCEFLTIRWREEPIPQDEHERNFK
ncbi:MAG: hypothetical protein ACRD2J_15925, partial [Thermoanaerobaculia bacterium]